MSSLGIYLVVACIVMLGFTSNLIRSKKERKLVEDFFLAKKELRNVTPEMTWAFINWVIVVVCRILMFSGFIMFIIF